MVQPCGRVEFISLILKSYLCQKLARGCVLRVMPCPQLFHSRQCKGIFNHSLYRLSPKALPPKLLPQMDSQFQSIFLIARPQTTAADQFFRSFFKYRKILDTIFFVVIDLCTQPRLYFPG